MDDFPLLKNKMFYMGCEMGSLPPSQRQIVCNYLCETGRLPPSQILTYMFYMGCEMGSLPPLPLRDKLYVIIYVRQGDYPLLKY